MGAILSASDIKLAKEFLKTKDFRVSINIENEQLRRHVRQYSDLHIEKQALLENIKELMEEKYQVGKLLVGQFNSGRYPYLLNYVNGEVLDNQKIKAENIDAKLKKRIEDTFVKITEPNEALDHGAEKILFREKQDYNNIAMELSALCQTIQKQKFNLEKNMNALKIEHKELSLRFSEMKGNLQTVQKEVWVLRKQNEQYFIEIQRINQLKAEMKAQNQVLQQKVRNLGSKKQEEVQNSDLDVLLQITLEKADKEISKRWEERLQKEKEAFKNEKEKFTLLLKGQLAQKEKAMAQMKLKAERDRFEMEKIKLYMSASRMENIIEAKGLFQESCLQGQSQDFLKATIQFETKMKLVGSVLLYKFQEKVKTNFHLAIDNKPHIVLIIKTALNKIIGAYSEAPVKREPETKNAILFSLTNRKVYHLKPNKNALAYDDDFIIIGKAEIRLERNKKQVYSNLGIPAGCFNSQGENSMEFIGKNNTAEILSYELYQMVFQE